MLLMFLLCLDLRGKENQGAALVLLLLFAPSWLLPPDLFTCKGRGESGSEAGKGTANLGDFQPRGRAADRPPARRQPPMDTGHQEELNQGPLEQAGAQLCTRWA